MNISTLTRAAAAFLVVCAMAGPALAQPVTAQQCLAAQLRQAGNACKGISRCYSKAMKLVTPVSTSCIDIRKDRLVTTVAEIELVANCLVTGVARSVGDQIHIGLEEIATDLTLDGGRCAAVKLATLAKACNGFFRCNAAADALSTTLDPACIAVQAARASSDFAKLDAGGKCVTTGDASALEGKVATLVDAVRVVLRGTGTTTTTATATTN